MDNVDFSLTITCLAAPFQAEGKIGDIPWEYRGRHGRYRLVIGDNTIMGSPEPDDELTFIMSQLSKPIIDAYVKRDDDAYDTAERQFYGG